MVTDTDKTAEMLFADALASFQASLPVIRKENTATVRSDKGNYSYAYADLTDISEAAMPLLAKVGLSFTATPTITDHGFVLRYALVHEGGHREGGDFPLPDPSKFGAHQIGSWLTYARRYALCAVTGVAPGGDDDDGEKSKGAVAAEPLPRAPRWPNATERKTAEQVTSEPDPWSTAEPAPEPERVTDQAWLEDFRRRITAAGTASELRGLQGEANGQWSQHKLSREDAALLRTEVDQRMKELKGEPAPVGAS